MRRESGGQFCPSVYCWSSVRYKELAEVEIRVYVTGFEKTLHMGHFVKIEFDASLISSTQS